MSVLVEVVLQHGVAGFEEMRSLICCDLFVIKGSSRLEIGSLMVEPYWYM